MNSSYLLIGSLVTSFLISYFAIPSIIKVAEIKNLFDVPCNRKRHNGSIPTLGGIAIFAGFIFSTTFWAQTDKLDVLHYIISSLIILFFMGIKDDIVNLVAHKKLAGQLIAAAILVLFADIRLNSLFGLFGVYDIPYRESAILSIIGIIGITNSFNLIDGIDTLAGSIGALVALIFGTWFFITNHLMYSLMSFSLLGSLLGFLIYNRTPAKIFMGDTGSLVIGLTCSILTIKFLEFNRDYTGPQGFKIQSAPAIALSILIVPIFDTCRVFFIRILKRKSPLSSDRNHIHHIFTDLGFSHHITTLILLAFNITLLTLALVFRRYNAELLTFMILFISLALSYILMMLRTKNIKRKKG